MRTVSKLDTPATTRECSTAGALASMAETEVAALETQLHAVLEAQPEFKEKLKAANRRKMQGGTDIPAIRGGRGGRAVWRRK